MKCNFCNYENKEGDRYCENCGASLENTSGAMDDISAITAPPAVTPADNGQNTASQPNNYGQPTGYGQPNNYGQPTGYGQPNNYGQPTGYGQPNNYGQPTGYGQPNNYGQPTGYGQYNNYGQPNGYGQQNMYQGPIYGFDHYGEYNEGDGSPKYVGFGGAISLYFKNFFNFKGRSTRSEFWWGYLFNFLVSLGVGFIFGIFIVANVFSDVDSYSNSSYYSTEKIMSDMYGYTAFLTIFGIVWAIPVWSAGVRRLHDAGKSGWWILLMLAGNIPSLMNLIPGFGMEMSSGLTCLCAPIALGGFIVNLVFWCQPSVGYNQWGAPAKPKMTR